MPKPDRGVSVFFLLLGGTVAWQASRLRIGEPGHPGPGFFPFVLALALCLLSAAQLLRFAWAGKDAAASAAQLPAHAAASPAGRRKLLRTFLALVVYAFALEPAGFALATFLFLLFLYRAVEPRRWVTALGGAATATVLCYALFRLLEVRLPVGLWMP